MKKNGNEICGSNWIERSNVLNEMRTPLNLTEMRLLLVYQSKINARNPSNAKVTFTLESFQKIMDIKNIDISALKKNMKKISQRSVEIPYKNGFQFVPLYQRCGLYQNDKGQWCIDLECNQEMLPYMFEMKKNYFKYQLWNSIRLTSLNQIRMYEILKQYEKIGKRTVSVEDLKNMLGINIKQYSQYRDFKRYVLDVCQKALEENTDIKYKYIPIKGAKGKVLSIEFNITKNPKFKDDLKLKEFINPSDLSDVLEPQKSVEVVESVEKSVESVKKVKKSVEIAESVEKVVEKSIPQPEPQQYPDLVTKVYNKCHKVYTMEQVQSLLDMAEMISNNPGAYIVNMYHTIRAYNTKINNMYNYTLSVIQANLSKKSKEPTKKKKRETSYDINEFMDFVHSTKRNMVGDDYQEKVNPTQPVENTSDYPKETPFEEAQEFYDDFEEILASGEIPF